LTKLRLSDNKYKKSYPFIKSAPEPLFGYSGAFDVQWLEVPEGKVPRYIKPRRHQRRE
jgi:hypothetical protein